MGTWSRYNFVVAKNDYPVKPAGENIFITPNDGNRKNHQAFNLRDGEIAVFDKKGDTLDETDIATADSVYMAVGVDRSGNGWADELRYLAGDKVDLVNGVVGASASGPICSAPQIVDVGIDCIEAEETYSISIGLDDPLVRSWYTTNEEAKYPISGVAKNLADCDDCEDSTDCGDLIDQWISEINNDVQDDPTMVTYFQNQDLVDQYQPFTAVRLYANSFDFCMTLEDGACEDCAHFTGITGITIDGTSYSFTYTTDPDDTTKSTEAHLNRIVSEINRAFSEDTANGSAVRISTFGKCCDFQVQVNTDAAAVTLNTDGGPQAHCDSSNPLTDLGKTCAMRLITDVVSVECACDWPTNKSVPPYWGRTINVQALSENFGFKGDAELVVSEVQAQVLPQGFGFFWQDQEHYKQHHGGGGGDFRYSNQYKGKVPLPNEGSRFVEASVADCTESYCQYFLQTRTSGKSDLGIHNIQHSPALTTFLVPSKNTTTRTSFETHLNAIKDRAQVTIADVSCSQG